MTRALGHAIRSLAQLFAESQGTQLTRNDRLQSLERSQGFQARGPSNEFDQVIVPICPHLSKVLHDLDVLP